MNKKLENRIEFAKILNGLKDRILFRNIGETKVSTNKLKKGINVDNYCLNAIITINSAYYYISYIPMTSDTWYEVYLINDEIINDYNSLDVKKRTNSLFEINKSGYYNIYTDTLYDTLESLPNVRLTMTNCDLKYFLSQWFK
jgi:hypothetical protein